MSVPCNNCTGKMTYVFDKCSYDELGYEEENKVYKCDSCGSKLYLSTLESKYTKLLKLVDKLIEK